MAPTRKSRSVNKRFSNTSDISHEKDGINSNKNKHRKTDKLGSQWSKKELQRFYEAYRKYGKDWKKVAAAVRNRSIEMVEALYNMNRAYLSLPEGTASVVGLIAMMTDHYNVLEESDSEMESNDAPQSRKPVKRKREKVQCSVSKDPVQSPSFASGDVCLPQPKTRRIDDAIHALNALQTLADLSLMMPTSMVNSGKNKINDIHTRAPATSKTTKKRTRGVTTLAWFDKQIPPDGGKWPIEYNHVNGKVRGQWKHIFVSYSSLLVRSKINICIPSWREVDKDSKDLLWQELTTKFDIPNTDKNKKKWLTHVAKLWTDFKSDLTTTYIYGDRDTDGRTSPVGVYSFLNEDTWRQFVKSRREDPNFEKKREKSRENALKNLYPHTLSRGGYDHLMEKLREEKQKEVGDDGESSVMDEPFQPDRYVLWPKARVKKTGGYTNEATTQMVEKIESLVEQSTLGTFVPEGREDILSVALGTAEHPGRVRTAGQGTGLKAYYGSVARGPVENSKKWKATEKEIEIRVMQTVQAQMQEYCKELISQQLSSQQQQIPDQQQDIVAVSRTSTKKVSTKATCSPPTENIDVFAQMGILAWNLPTGNCHLPMDHLPGVACYLERKDLSDLALSYKWLSDGHITFWFQYLYRTMLQNDFNDLYEFLDPYYLVQKCDLGKDSKKMKEYIQEKLTVNPASRRKKCYLGAYASGKNWSLFVINPAENKIWWIDSMYDRPSRHIFNAIDGAMLYYNMMITSQRNKRKAEWIYTEGPKQPSEWECGYYVMIMALVIVESGMTEGFHFAYCDKKPYPSSKINEVRETWTRLFLEEIEKHKDFPGFPEAFD